MQNKKWELDSENFRSLTGRIDQIKLNPRGNTGILIIGFYPPGRITPERSYRLKLGLPRLLELDLREFDELTVTWDKKRDCITKVNFS